jgi:predicted nucleic acid-binding protein
VAVELLLGARRPETARLLQEDLRALAFLPLGLEEASIAAEIGQRLAQQGQRVPTADLLIAGAARAHAYAVWHYGDEHFVVISQAGGPDQRDLAHPSTP